MHEKRLEARLLRPVPAPYYMLHNTDFFAISH